MPNALWPNRAERLDANENEVGIVQTEHERAELLEQRLVIDRRWHEEVIVDLFRMRMQYQETLRRVFAIQAGPPVQDDEMRRLTMQRVRLEELERAIQDAGGRATMLAEDIARTEAQLAGPDLLNQG